MIEYDQEIQNVSQSQTNPSHHEEETLNTDIYTTSLN